MKFRYLFLFVISITMFFNQNSIAQLNSNELGVLVDKTLKKYNLPAIAVVIVNSNAIVSAEVRGVRVQNTNQKATLNDYFHIGSCSKSVLALIAGKLVESGKINWHTPFFEIFPELKDASRQEYFNITLEDLFLCKAGIKAYTSGAEVYPTIDTTSLSLRYGFAKYLLQQVPSSKYANGAFEFLYSNAGYTVAAQMLERVSGLSYEELIDLYFNKELGIDSHFGFPNSFDSQQPWGHMINGKKLDIFPPEHEYKLNYLIKPAGDLSMSPINYAKYMQLSLKGLRSEDNFISSKTYNYMHFGHKRFSIGIGNGEMGGHKFSGMDGSAGTFFCRTINIPDSDFAFTVMTNAGSGTGHMKSVDWLTMKILKKHFNWWWKFWI